MLAADVVAAEDVPPFANSAVDGYAVRAGRRRRRRRSTCAVVAEVAAGAAAPIDCSGAGEAIRIMTGAPMPAGADAVVMVEETERLDGGARVRVRRCRPGRRRAPGGQRRGAGTVVFTAGTVVTPAVVGVLASVNAATVTAHPAARVGRAVDR